MELCGGDLSEHELCQQPLVEVKIVQSLQVDARGSTQVTYQAPIGPSRLDSRVGRHRTAALASRAEGAGSFLGCGKVIMLVF